MDKTFTFERITYVKKVLGTNYITGTGITGCVRYIKYLFNYGTIETGMLAGVDCTIQDNSICVRTPVLRRSISLITLRDLVQPYLSLCVRVSTGYILSFGLRFWTAFLAPKNCDYGKYETNDKRNERV